MNTANTIAYTMQFATNSLLDEIILNCFEINITRL